MLKLKLLFKLIYIFFINLKSLKNYSNLKMIMSGISKNIYTFVSLYFSFSDLFFKISSYNFKIHF